MTRSSWKLQAAKARLSEVVRLARDNGPQEITVHGEPAAVLMSKADFDKLASREESLVDFLRNSPLFGLELEIERDAAPARTVRL